MGICNYIFASFARCRNMKLKSKHRALVEEMVCAVCGREFFRRKKSVNRRVSITGVQKSNAMTCSRNCSRKYIRDGWKRTREKNRTLKSRKTNK